MRFETQDDAMPVTQGKNVWSAKSLITLPKCADPKHPSRARYTTYKKTSDEDQLYVQSVETVCAVDTWMSGMKN